MGRPLASIALAAVALFAADAYGATSGSMSRTCSGQIRVCDGALCESRHFFISAFQYAYVDDGTLLSESHTLSVSGALGESSDYDEPSSRVQGNFVHYVGPEVTLAIPWDARFGLYARLNDTGPAGEWQLLCAGSGPGGGGGGGPGGAGGGSDPEAGPVDDGRDGTSALSKACSGKIKTCDHGSCIDQPFYAYTYQFASVVGRKLVSESHTLSVSGELGTTDDYELRGVTGGHVIYEGPRYFLAAPYRAGGRSFAKAKLGPVSGWQTLCR